MSAVPHHGLMDYEYSWLVVVRVRLQVAILVKIVRHSSELLQLTYFRAATECTGGPCRSRGRQDNQTSCTFKGGHDLEYDM